MRGSTELAQLAELLRVGAQTGRQIATMRPRDAQDIERLAVAAEGIADNLDLLIAREEREIRGAGETG